MVSGKKLGDLIGGVLKRQLGPVKQDIEFIKERISEISTTLDQLEERLKNIERVLVERVELE